MTRRPANLRRTATSPTATTLPGRRAQRSGRQGRTRNQGQGQAQEQAEAGDQSKHSDNGSAKPAEQVASNESPSSATAVTPVQPPAAVQPTETVGATTGSGSGELKTRSTKRIKGSGRRLGRSGRGEERRPARHGARLSAPLATAAAASTSPRHENDEPSPRSAKQRSGATVGGRADRRSRTRRLPIRAARRDRRRRRVRVRHPSTGAAGPARRGRSAGGFFDGPCQPACIRSPPGRGMEALGTVRTSTRSRDARPQWLQAAQRHPRSQGRRPGAARSGEPAPRPASHDRHGSATRRRRVRGAMSGDTEARDSKH